MRRLIAMSRVERNSPNEEHPRRNEEPRDAVDRTPGKAEGEEETVERALEKEESAER